MNRVERCVRCFEKDGDELLKILPLKEVTLAQLQKIFGVSAENPMYDCFSINPNQAEMLEPYLSEKLDLANCECFLECDAMSLTDSENP